MKLAIATLLALGLLTFTVLEAEAAVDPNAMKQSFACPDIQKAASKLQVFADNIENKDTVKTAEGGPYKRVDVNCRELFCETSAQADFKLVKMPEHPNANGAGYVQFPNIDLASQYASLSSAAAEVRLLGENKTCGATALGNSAMAMIKYGSASTIQQDTFNYATDGHLTSWTRILKDGTSKSYAFAQDGSIVR
jgi:flagellar basal body rod protein FlgC